MINTKKFEVENMFHSYVRPEIHPMLSDICLETNSGIKQKMVDSAPNFKQVFWSFSLLVSNCFNSIFVLIWIFVPWKN